MLIRRRLTVLIALTGTAAALAAAGPARATSAAPATQAASAAQGARGALAARASADAGVPSSAGPRLIKDIQEAETVANGSGVTVAVLSTGVDPATPGLTGKVTTGPDFTGSAHPVRITGSVVAGFVAGNDPTGADNGLAPAARILSIRTSEESTEPGSSAFYSGSDTAGIDTRAIQYAVGHGAQVIFIDSLLGGSLLDGPSHPLESAVHDAVAKHVVIVAIDGYFDSGAGWDYPSALPGVIGVGSVDLAGWPAPYENTRSVRDGSVLISAPGNTDSSPVGGNGQSFSIDGPEAAAAFVTGTVALIKSLYPHLSPMLVERALALSARYRPTGGYSTTLGFGLVNPYGALAEAAQMAKLSGAAASPAVTAGTPSGQDAAATFRSGPPLPAIEAVHHSNVKLAGYGAAAVIGVICLIGAFLLRRSRARGATGIVRPAPGDASQQFAEP
jgi:Subtilase family